MKMSRSNQPISRASDGARGEVQPLVPSPYRKPSKCAALRCVCPGFLARRKKRYAHLPVPQISARLENSGP